MKTDECKLAQRTPQATRKYSSAYVLATIVPAFQQEIPAVDRAVVCVMNERAGCCSAAAARGRPSTSFGDSSRSLALQQGYMLAQIIDEIRAPDRAVEGGGRPWRPRRLRRFPRHFGGPTQLLPRSCPSGPRGRL